MAVAITDDRKQDRLAENWLRSVDKCGQHRNVEYGSLRIEQVRNEAARENRIVD